MTPGPRRTAAGTVVRLNSNWLVQLCFEPAIHRTAGKRCCHNHCMPVRYKTDNLLEDCSVGYKTGSPLENCFLRYNTGYSLGNCSVCYKMSNLLESCSVDHCREPGSGSNMETRLLGNHTLPGYLVQCCTSHSQSDCLQLHSLLRFDWLQLVGSQLLPVTDQLDSLPL